MSARAAVRWTAFALVAVPALVRACVAHAPFPVWDADPFLVPAPPTELGPTAMLVLDLVACLGCALAIASAARVRRWTVAAFALGSIGVLIHVAQSVEHAQPGVHWIGAMASGLGAWHLAQDRSVRRVLLACVVGVVGVLVAKGVEQIAVEHPMTVAHFERTKDEFFRARGWTEGSRAARIYERRLLQPAATGWFGLANVYATFVGAGVVVLGALAVGVWRRARELPGVIAAVVLGLGAAACAWGVWATGSKGAGGAVVLGGVAAVAFGTLARAKRVDRALRVGVALAPAAVLAGVALRGVIGARLGELSLLFRSFYLEGAARIWATHPWVGVGPAGFKDAYLLARPAMSPEEVTSPHALAADWASTLGVLGVAWVAVFVWWLLGAGRREVAGEAGPGEGGVSTGTGARVVFVVGAVAVVASALVARAAASPEGAITLGVGLLAWVAIGWGVLVAFERGEPRWVRAAVAGGAVMIGAHLQLDMTGVQGGSAALVLTILAALAAGGETPGSCPRRAWVWAGVPVGVAAVGGAMSLGAVWRWERALIEAGGPAARFAILRGELEQARSAPEAERALAAMGEAWGVERPERWDGASAERVVNEAQARAIDEACGGLTRAIEARPRHHGTRVALGRLLLARGELDPSDPGAGIEARSIAERETELSPGSASAWMWAGTVRATLAARAPEGSGRRGMLASGLEAWARAAALDPHGIDAPVRAMRVADELGRDEEAGRWAERALAADEAFRLDPLKRLSDGERAEAEELVRREGESGGGAGAETP